MSDQQQFDLLRQILFRRAPAINLRGPEHRTPHADAQPAHPLATGPAAFCPAQS